ncbi:hypothetical protein Acr_03g0014730 [Actinidia rufa]|uniref:Major facilitator superfamily protein n=1 Tax=Actinidia rufa TaxID=165716 RepID=A0A7J0EFQ1_9ERIC|nr:hypothetical protein Acr_03g0014730 [Actinidia rufa]
MFKSKVESRSWNFFNWSYFCMGMASLTALTVVALLFISRLNQGKSSGEIVVYIQDLTQVIVAAMKKRKEVAPQDTGCLLAAVHRVEELKCIIRLLPIWAAGILHVTSHSHQHSFGIIQARSVDRHLSHSFQIPPASLSIFSILTVLIGLVLYERALVPFARRFTGNPTGITCLQRMGIGFVVNILATIVSALVEIKRKAMAAQHNLLDKSSAVIPISVFWLMPQFCLHGIAEVFVSVGQLEFLYDQSPESMRSTAAALYWIAISIGN